MLLPVATGADSAALRTGLWELSFKSALTLEQARRLSAKIPQTWLKQVPLTQRAEFERQYRRGELLRNALNGVDTLCITEDDLEQGIQPHTDLEVWCTVQQAKTEKTWQQLHLACASPGDEQDGNAVIDISVSTATEFGGTITRTLATANHPLSVKVELHGTWLDSQCGEAALEEDETPLR